VRRESLALREIAWLDDARMAAIVRARRADFIAVFEGRSRRRDRPLELAS
jgi:hypothetical protein